MREWEVDGWEKADWEREWEMEGPAAEDGEVVIVEVLRKTSFITMGRRIHAPLY